MSDMVDGGLGPERESPVEGVPRTDPRKDLREKVNLVLSDGFMIFLAALMIPTVILRLVGDLPEEVAQFLYFTDIAILGVFVLEYVLKLTLSEDRAKYFRDGWHLLDLAILLLPIFEFIPIFGTLPTRSSPILRLLRVARILAVGGRSVRRGAHGPEARASIEPPMPPMRIRAVGEDLGAVRDHLSLDEVPKLLGNPHPTWIDITGVTDEDIGKLSGALLVPELVLGNKLAEDSYPRIDAGEHYSLIFVQSGHCEVRPGEAAGLLISRTGLLIMTYGPNLVTISRKDSNLFETVRWKADQHLGHGRSLTLTVLYALLEHVIERYRAMVAEVERELLRLESIPKGDTPRDFLTTSFQLKKEVNRIVSSLLHLKEILTVITSGRVPLEGFEDLHAEMFDLHLDDIVYLHETAQNCKENLNSLIELHINTTSYDTNNVMRVIAVISTLALIPALVGGMLGMNLHDSPWNVELWQVTAVTIVTMLATGYVFYRLGWLR